MLRIHTSTTAILALSLLPSIGCRTGSAPQGHRLRPTEAVRGIFEDSRGVLWIVSPDWLCRYEPESDHDAFTYFEEIEVGSMAAAIQEDASGRILAQSKRGILRYDEGQFHKLGDRNYAPGASWDARPGDLWFGNDRGVEIDDREQAWGVHRYRDGRTTFLRFPVAGREGEQGFHPLTAPVLRGHDGTLWFGTFEAAIGFDGEGFQVLDRRRMGRTDDPRHVGLRNHYLDSRNLLWMADNGAGVYVFDGKEVVHFTALHGLRDEDTDGLPLDRSFSVGEDCDGAIWFGTAYSGACRYEPSPDDPIGTGTFTWFGPDDGMPCQNIWMMYRTRNGELLFAGEKPGGVYRFDGQRFERFL